MFCNCKNQYGRASASSAAAFSSCAALFVMDAVLLASILFCLTVLGLQVLGVLVILVALISILRIIPGKSEQPERLA